MSERTLQASAGSNDKVEGTTSAGEKNRPRAKVLSLYIGLGIACTGAILLAAGVMIPGLSIPTQLYKKEFDFNFSFFIYIAMIFGGLVVASSYYRSVSVKAGFNAGFWKEKGVLKSIPWTRFIAAGMLVAVGIASYLAFGLGFANDHKKGLWLYLAGPSLFFPSGLFPLVVGMILLLYGFFAIKTIQFKKKNGILQVIETRLGRTITTGIPKKDITVARLTNARIGAHHLWVLWFLLQVYLLYSDGLAFLFNPHAFGAGITAGIMYVASASVQLVACGLLVLGKKHDLEIITPDKIYEVQFELPPSMPARSATMNTVLQDEFSNAGGKENEANGAHGKMDLAATRTYTRLLVGATFVALAILDRIFLFYTGELLRFMFLLSGAILITQSLTRDMRTVSKPVQVKKVDSFPGMGNTMLLSFQGSRLEEFLIRDADRMDVTPSIKARKIEIVDHVIMVGLAGFIGYDITSTFLLGGVGHLMAVGMIILHVLAGIGALFLLFIASVNLRNAVEIDAGVKRYQFFFKQKSGEKRDRGNLLEHLNHGMAALKNALIKKDRALTSRFFELLVATSAGIVIALIGFLS